MRFPSCRGRVVPGVHGSIPSSMAFLVEGVFDRFHGLDACTACTDTGRDSEVPQSVQGSASCKICELKAWNRPSPLG